MRAVSARSAYRNAAVKWIRPPASVSTHATRRRSTCRLPSPTQHPPSEHVIVCIRTRSGSVTSTTRAYRFNLNGSTLDRGVPQLEVNGVSLRFGGVQALRDVTVTIEQGEIHAIIGPNGAGKTSLLNCVNGLYRPQHGTIRLRDRDAVHDLTRARPSRIARWRVARSFQYIELLRHMTVLEDRK